MDELSTFTQAQVDRLFQRFNQARLVRNPKRRRKLVRRGHLLRWSPELQGWLWEPCAWVKPARQPGWSALREALRAQGVGADGPVLAE